MALKLLTTRRCAVPWTQLFVVLITLSAVTVIVPRPTTDKIHHTIAIIYYNELTEPTEAYYLISTSQQLRLTARWRVQFQLSIVIC